METDDRRKSPERIRAGATASRRSDRYERRYWEVMDAAAAVFAERGYHGASTQDIADRLGIRQASLYYYFTSKEAALEEVAYRGVEAFVEGLAAIEARGGPAGERLRAAVLNHLHPLRDRTDYVRVFNFERRFLPPGSRRGIAAMGRRYEDMIEGLLASGIEDGVFRTDLDCRLSALALIGLLNSVTTWFGRREHQRTIDQIAERYTTLFIEGIAANGGTGTTQNHRGNDR